MTMTGALGRPNVIDAFASETHYAANVFPVLEALPELYRGRLCDPKTPSVSNHVVVASYNDLRQVYTRKVVFMEHGVGQTYGDDLASYAGSRRRDGVVLFLNPNERVAEANYQTHPDVPGAVVGSPKMDPWWDAVPEGGVVGLSWHWDAQFVPEARTALPQYESVLTELGQRFRCIGTAHPRIANIAAQVYDAAGIPFTMDATELYRHASVLVCDNTTLGWEFIALDRPVVWCNAPWYRRQVQHGIRFWEYIDSGIEIDEPVELIWAVDKALERDDKHARRMEVADVLYPYRDGTSAARAAEAIVSLVEGGKHGRRPAAARHR
jgi:hypothetical protein